MSTYTSEVSPNSKTALPEPLCKPFRHPIRFTIQKIQMLAYTALGAYVGMLIVVALYYLLFETTTTMNNWWHSTVPNSDVRHSIRNVGEGLLGGLLGLQLAWNHYKKKNQKKFAKKPNLLDRLEIALHIPNVKDGKPFSVFQLLVTPFLVVLYAVPGFFVGLQVVNFFHHHPLHVGISTNPTTATFAEKFKATWTQDWPKKLVGYFAAFCFGRRPAKGMFDDIQLLSVQRRAANASTPRWWHSAAYKARFNDYLAHDYYQTNDLVVTPWVHRLTMAALPFAILAAGFGFYVLTFIAK